VLRLALGEMADELLLASARLVPGRLLETGFRFRDPELEPALRHMLGRMEDE
jgi:NAD dependent epimerase/dehydratase family enzyme